MMISIDQALQTPAARAGLRPGFSTKRILSMTRDRTYETQQVEGKCQMKSQQTSSGITFRGAMFTLIVTLAFGFLTDSSGQPYEISSFVIAGGGGESTSGSYAVHGTIGQPIVDVSANANYIVGAGFWGGLVQTFRVSIDAIWWSAGQGVRIAWHSVGGATYVVHFADSLSSTWKAIATLAGTGAIMEWLDDGSQTGVSPTVGSVIKRFYKLSGQP